MQMLLLGVALVVALGVGAALGPSLFGANAATSSTTATSSTATSSTAATVKSNEATAHEKGESAAREAAENNGTATFGNGN
jgi:hypothetical protein